MGKQNKWGVKVETRDPIVTTRDPVIEPRPQRKARRYISANMPTVCPDCGHNTRTTSGRHIDPVRQRVLEYRDCIKCGALLAAGRPMTKTEIETLCTRAEAVKEYEQSLVQ